MTTTNDLFEEIKTAVCAEYISDIRTPRYRDGARKIMRVIDLSDYPISQLEDMSEYLYGEKQSFADVESAKAYFRAK